MHALSAEDLLDEFADERRLIGRHVSGTLRLPEDWGDEWLGRLAGSEDAECFAARLRREIDQDIGDMAMAFLQAARDLRQATNGLNPLRARCRELLDELGGRTFLVLLQWPHPRCKQLYMTLDPRFTDASLCTESELRRQNRFVDVLVTTGRFDRFTPDHILTAARWSSIVNIRWSGDVDDREDFPLFPHLTIRNKTPALGDVVPEATHPPVTVKRRLINAPQSTNELADSDMSEDGSEWDAITFDEWFLGKRERLRRNGQKPVERPASYSGLAVYIGTSDGGGLFTPINENGIARSLPVFDPLENVVAMRRPALDPAAEGDRKDYLEEGMMLVLPEEAVEGNDHTGSRRRTQNATERSTLRLRWKRKLGELVRLRGVDRIASQLERLGVILGNLPASVQRWIREDGINAPRSEDHFRILVQDLLEMRDPDDALEQQDPWWERAWDAVLYERSLCISMGLLEESERDRLVKDAILSQIELVTDAARRSAGVTVSVGDGQGKVRVVTVEFIETEIDGRRFQVPEEQCLRYVELHDARFRWLQ